VGDLAAEAAAAIGVVEVVADLDGYTGPATVVTHTVTPDARAGPDVTGGAGEFHQMRIAERAIFASRDHGSTRSATRALPV
jgi:hypothetical protein